MAADTNFIAQLLVLRFESVKFDLLWGVLLFVEDVSQEEITGGVSLSLSQTIDTRAHIVLLFETHQVADLLEADTTRWVRGRLAGLVQRCGRGSGR